MLRTVKGRFLSVNDHNQGFSLIPAKELFFKKLKKKKQFFTPPEIWLEPKSCLCSIYDNFVKHYYFDLKFAVFLAITFHYDVLIGLFDNMIRVVVGVRSHPTNFRNALLALFYYFS